MIYTDPYTVCVFGQKHVVDYCSLHEEINDIIYEQNKYIKNLSQR